MNQQFLEDIAGTIRFTPYINNVAQVATSALVTLKKPDKSVLQASTSASVNSTTGEITYSLTTTHTANRDLNFIAEWVYVIGSNTYYQTQLFDVVRSILSIPITDDDLFDELDSLRIQQLQDTSVATSATSSTLLDTAQRKESDDFWNGGVIEITSGTGVNQVRTITDFVQSSSTITVSPNWVTTPDTTSQYKITRSFTNKIRQGFEALETMIYNKGRRHQLILESSQIKFPLIYLVIHNICSDLMNQDGDRWHILSQSYYDKFEKSFGNMKLEYDADDSGNITDDEEQYKVSTVDLYRS